MYVNAANIELKLSGKAANVPVLTSGRDVITGTDKNDSFQMSGGDVISGGLGDDSYYVYDNTSTIIEQAGGGIDTVYARQWGTATLADNVENLILGGKGTTVGIGNALDNIIMATAVGARLNGMQGNDVLVGGDGSDVFEIDRGNGSDVIMNFTHGKDMIALLGYNFTNMAQVRAAATQVGSDLRLDLGGGENLIIRDMSIKGLTASDFSFGIDKVGAMAANAFDVIAYDKNAPTQQMWGGYGVFTNQGWYVLNGAWNVGGLVAYKDYSINSSFTKNNLNEGITFNWTFKDNTAPFPIIRAYPDILFGAAPKGNTVDSTKTFPIKVSDITSLEANYDVTYRGDGKGFNVSFDFYLTTVPNGGAATIANEVMIWLHKGDFPAAGERIGTFEDGDFAATIWYDAKTKYTAIVANDDWNKGTINIAKVIAKLVNLGIASTDSYFASIQLGSEVVEGKGSLTINKFDLAVQTANADGTFTQKLVTNSGVISKVLPVPADALAVSKPVVPSVVLPVAANDHLPSINEDSGTRTIAVADLLANDSNGGAGTLAVTSVTGVVGGTAVLSADGKSILFTPTANYHGQGGFTYQVGNGQGVATALASFDIIHVNHVPTDLVLSNAQVAENSIAGTVVGNLAATDVDGDPLTYTLVDNAGGHFAIDPANVKLVVGANAALDYETATSHQVTVRATDVAGAYVDQTFTIGVTDVAEVQRDGTARADAIVVTDSSDWTINGLAGADTIKTAGGNDVVDGGTGNDWISTGAGDDVILFGLTAGRDTIDGGAGYDVIKAAVDNATLTWGSYTGVEAFSGDGHTGVSVVGTSGNDLIDLSGYTVTGPILFDGGAGNDTIIGTAGDDLLTGGSGYDVIRAGGGNDVILFGPSTGLDTIDGGAGYDVLRASQDGAVLKWGSFTSVEAISGGGFANVQILGNSSAELIDLSTYIVDGIAAINGGGGNDTIIGTAQDDTIIGGSGNDELHGGAGNDLFLVGPGAGTDVIDGGAGTDEVRATADGTVIGWGGYTSVEVISSGGFANVSVRGTAGADLMDFSGIALNGISLLAGGAGNDTIIGSAGNDTITGNEGADQLTGGGGADVFVFNSSRDSRADTGIDVITDFTDGVDKIDITRVDANSLVASDQAFTFLGTADFTGQRGVLRYEIGSNGDTHVLFDANGDKIADFDLVLTGAHVLTADDFLL